MDLLESLNMVDEASCYTMNDYADEIENEVMSDEEFTQLISKEPTGNGCKHEYLSGVKVLTVEQYEVVKRNRRASSEA